MGLGGHRPLLQLRPVPVVADRFDWATFHRFFAETFFIRRLRLFIDVRVAAIIIPFEIRGRGLAAQIAVDALIIDIEFARYAFGVFVRCVRHVSLKVK
jgi:hypothetical protein